MKKRRKPKYIYAITAMKFGLMYRNKRRSKDKKFHSFCKRTSKSQLEHFTIIRQRTWGWYSTLRSAKLAVTKWASHAILEDLYYPEVVIERIPEGIMSGIPREWWYKWKGSERKGNYVTWEKPEEYKRIGFFAMG